VHTPLPLDANDTFVQALARIWLSVRKGLNWQSLDESTKAELLRTIPDIERIIDERWLTIGETVNGWRSTKAIELCSFDVVLNAANTKNQVGTEQAEQADYTTYRMDASGDPFDGANAYVLYLEPGRTPPVAGMWNLAMYDEEISFTTSRTVSPSEARRTASP
jgi:hypothetical protein